MLEHVEKNASIYILMHYFVTLEQEFYNHLIAPFININGNSLQKEICRDAYLKTTHDILIGKTHFSIGAISHLGKNINNFNAKKKSKALDMYSKFMEAELDEYIALCNSISNLRIGTISLKDMRNGLAHGNAEIINRIDSSAYHSLRKCLLEAPDSVVMKILTLSKIS